MRLSEVLSNPIASQFEQVDGFLNNTRLKTGKQKKIDIGAVFLTFFCKNCNANITFLSGEELHCIGINDHLVSIDCVVSCSRCGQTVPIWFLVESRNEIYSRVPEVRILKRTEKLSDKVLLGTERYGEYSTWLEKADRAYHDELGAGAIVYLRQILETATIQVAQRQGINISSTLRSIALSKIILMNRSPSLKPEASTLNVPTFNLRLGRKIGAMSL